ncbi:hypothetical protein E6C64_13365 [Naasia lichenicola]|uniref:Uncharacterized protein n=1 Tax=Naasia lichenicola TaxID=2565933 RepID=A0A4S4FIP3_9MICO|nr:hypothetical protein E6C64_13365 [Naasia lichenicola]
MLRRLRDGQKDAGYTLIVVTGIGLVMLLFVATSLTVASSGYKKAHTDDDWNAALSAAYGGLEEYQTRLSNDSTYVKYGNPSAPFSATSTDTGTAAGSTLLTLPGTPNVNTAFGIGAAGTWSSIPGGASKFRYEVNTKDYSASGIVHLRVTGKANNSTRSIIADLKQSGFLDFVYFSDYEIQDPQISGASSSCVKYAWDGRVATSNCVNIQFGAFDVINGPLHSNDQLLVCGARFKGVVTSSSTTTPIYSKSGCSSTTSYFEKNTDNAPAYHGTIAMPVTNDQLQTETYTDLASVADPGCLYTGPTTITFNSNGTMTIISPWTQFTQTNSAGTVGAKPDRCGKPGNGNNQLGNIAGATIPTLPSNLIYVQSVPSNSGSDVNKGTASSPPNNFTCTNTNGIAGWTFSKNGTTIQYPMVGEDTPLGSSSTNPAYGCTNGDAYVKGAFDGSMTVGAKNYIYITGDITYVNATSDILGLISTNAVYVWNPDVATGGTSGDRTIQASILSVAHTFQVQNYNSGSLKGTLNVYGAIAQKYRGTVATSSGGVRNSGYAKNYVYDERLRYTAPPKFLTPTSTTYDVSQVASVPAAFSATGAIN